MSEIDAAFFFLFVRDVGLAFVESNAKAVELVFDEMFVRERFECVETNADQIARLCHSNDLTTTTFAVLRTFDNTRQIQQLTEKTTIVVSDV